MKRRSFLQVGILAAADTRAAHLTGSSPLDPALIHDQVRAIMTSPYAIPRSVRQTDALVGNGGKIYGPFDGFRIFDNEDVVVWVCPDGAAAFAKVGVTVAKVSGLSFDYFTVEFADNVPVSTQFIVSSERVQERTAGVGTGTMIDRTALEEELSKQSTVLQELRRDVDRTVRMGIGAGEPRTIDPGLDEGSTLVMGPNGRITKGPPVGDTVQSVMTRGLMKAFPPLPVGRSVILKEEGRQGTFVSRAGSPPVADTEEGVYAVSNFHGYYWERIFAPERIPNVRAFGARLNGETNDSAAIAGAIAVCGEAYIPWTPSGFVAGGLALGTNQRIGGERKTIWTAPPGISYCVRVTSDGAGAHGILENFLFDLAACPTTTTAVRLGTSTGVVFGFRGRNLDFRNCGEAVGDETHATNYVVDIMLTDCYCYLTRGRQIYLRRSRGFVTARDFKIDHTFNTGAQVTWEGARFENFIGLELEKFDVVGPSLITPVTYLAESIGLVIKGDPNGKASVWLTRVLVDNTRGPGIDISDLFNLFSTNTCAYQNLGSGILLTDVKEAVFSNTSIAGGKDVPGSPGSASGMVMQRVTRSKFSNTQIKDCDGNGVVVSDSSRVLFTDFSAEGCTGVGYQELGTSNLNQVKGASYLNNAGGNFIQFGAASVHTEWISSAGALTARTVGPATT
ncbi:right-handed parallel beta-helix repeat-containing protein [Ensifer canadensis]